MTPDKINRYNTLLLERLSLVLNQFPDFIKDSMITELTNACHLNKQEAFSYLLAELCGLDIVNRMEDRELYDHYFSSMVHQLDKEIYTNNPYYRNIKIPNSHVGKWNFKVESYKPYEAFVFQDLKKMADGRLIPQIGFFDSEFSYPAVLENNREWMLITPNEIETMKDAITAAHGNVLTYGLGLGYYAYMVSHKDNVSSVTIVEKDLDVITLFKQYILPQFNHADKINIIHEDAFSYAKRLKDDTFYNFIFTDLWHDPSDGVSMYLKMKQYENTSSGCDYMYWIEPTLTCYLT